MTKPKLAKSPGMPHCPCYETELGWLLRQAVTENSATIFANLFLQMAKDDNVCDQAKPWFAAMCLIGVAAILSDNGIERKIKDMTKEQVTQANYATRVTLDHIYEMASGYLEERSKEMADDKV